MNKNKDIDKKNTENSASKKKKTSGLMSLLKSKQAKRGTVAIILTVIFVAVIVGLNIVTNILTTKYSGLSVDLTYNDVYKLTDPTLEQLKKLDKDINIYVLTTEDNVEATGDYYVQINKLLHEFEKSSKHINLKYVDVSSDPAFTAKYPDINWYTSSYFMIVENGDNYLTVSEEDVFTYEQDSTTGEYKITGQKLEQALMTAILNIITEDKVGVSFLEVKSEVDSSALKALLSNNAYNVDTVSLLTNDIPEESQFVVIYAPLNDIDKNAYDKLTNWLNNDGKYGHTLIYVPNSMSITDTPNLDTLLEEWGMAVSDNIIHETDSNYMVIMGQSQNYISRYTYENADFTSDMTSTSIPVVMSFCTPVELINTSASSLLSSSEYAVVRPLDADETWNPEEQEPQKLSGAAISTQGNEDNTKSSNVVVIGSFEALSQTMLSTPSFNNSAYFINLFNTIAKRESISITIEGKALDTDELGITSVSTATIIIIVVRYIIPLAVIVAGIIVWIRRRHK